MGAPLPKAAIAEPTAAPQPRLLKRVQEMLGVPRLRTDQDLLRKAEDGLATGALDGLQPSGLTVDEIYSLIVPRRTLTHRRARRESLSRDEPDRAVRLARIAWGTGLWRRWTRVALAPRCQAAVEGNAAPCNLQRLRQARASSKSCCTASTRIWRPRCFSGGSATISPSRVTEHCARRVAGILAVGASSILLKVLPPRRSRSSFTLRSRSRIFLCATAC